MSGLGDLDFSQLKKLQNRLNRLGDPNILIESIAKEIAARLLAKVKRLTPTGDHPEGEGKNGGTLRKNWRVDKIKRIGDMYYIEVVNPTEYASYVEFGHRQEPGRYVPAIGKKLKKGWVKGKFMLKISADEVRDITPQIIKKKINNYLGGMFK